MADGPYAIFRLMKYRKSEISPIEAHHERLKAKYKSNKEIDLERTYLNFHIVDPAGRYRRLVDHQVKEAGCRTRKDGIFLMEALITASPEFMAEKSEKEIRRYFERAVEFMKTKQDEKTIISAVVHMDEATPHMHLTFVPLTPNKRLCAKEIAGNREKMIWWQDEFWAYMVQEFPNLERGESASVTGRTHIPTRLFKEAARLNRQKDHLTKLLSEINPLNVKAKSKEIATMLNDYIPGVEALMTKLKKSSKASKELRGEIADLKKQVDINKASVLRQLELEKKAQEIDDLQHMVDSLQKLIGEIPEDVLAEYHTVEKGEKDYTHQK